MEREKQLLQVGELFLPDFEPFLPAPEPDPKTYRYRYLPVSDSGLLDVDICILVGSVTFSCRIRTRCVGTFAGFLVKIDI